MTPSVSGTRLLPWLTLGLLVLASTGAHAWLSRSFTVPWIAPDEMLYALTGQSLWETGELTVRGLETPYYSLLYPALVGLPLMAGSVTAGIERAQVLQALVMSLAAVPVFVWGRQFLSTAGALAAAALTLALPALIYSGLLMTEALYYPLLVLALYELARVLEEPTAWRQGIFLGTVVLAASVRMQALILIPALALAALLFARLTRSWEITRRLLPLFAGFAAGAIVLVLLSATGHGLSWQDMLGAYGTLGDESVLTAGVAEEVVWHLAGLAVAVAGIPLVVTALLVCRAVRHGEPDRHAASFLACVSAYVPLLLAQVGVFASGHLDHVSERYLVTATPPLLLGLVLWVERGMPRPRVLLAALAGLFLVVLATAPPDRIAPPDGIQDALSSAFLADLGGETESAWVRVALVAAGLACIAAIAFTPRRAGPVVIGLVGAALLVQTGLAARDVEHASAGEQQKALGSDPPRWIDALAVRPVTLLATGDRPWTADARTFFWNDAIRDVVAVDGAPVPVPPSAVHTEMRESDGMLVEPGGVLVRRELVAAPSSLVLDGSKVAQVQAAGAETMGLTLWRLRSDVRILQRRRGFHPNGDITDDAAVVVPGCTRGALEITFIGKSGAPIDVTVNGFSLPRVTAHAGTVLDASLPAPPDADGSRACVFELHTVNLVGTSRIEFVRG